MLNRAERPMRPACRASPTRIRFAAGSILSFLASDLRPYAGDSKKNPSSLAIQTAVRGTLVSCPHCPSPSSRIVRCGKFDVGVGSLVFGLKRPASRLSRSCVGSWCRTSHNVSQQQAEALIKCRYRNPSFELELVTRELLAQTAWTRASCLRPQYVTTALACE